MGGAAVGKHAVPKTDNPFLPVSRDEDDPQSAQALRDVQVYCADYHDR
jgi:hypothetical protein